MAKSSGIRAGKAFVELAADDSKMQRALKRASRSLAAYGKMVGNIGRTMQRVGAATAGIGLAAISGFAPLIKMAGDANETLNRFQAVFADTADQAEADAQRMAKDVGRSIHDIRDGMSSLGGLFIGLEFDATDAQKMSAEVQALALDFASFNNVTDDDAINRFIAGLSGSSEVFARYGINIKEAAINQELLSKGVAGGASAATEQQKVMARLAIITRSMTKQGAVGDAIKTAFEFANATKRLTSFLYDLGVTIGAAVIPVITPYLNQANRIVEIMGTWAKQNQNLIATVFKVAAVVVGAGAAIAGIGTAIVGLGLAMKIAAIGIGGLASVAGVGAAALGLLLSPLGLVAAAVVGTAAAIGIAAIRSGDAIGWLREKFEAARAKIVAAMSAVSSAINGVVSTIAASTGKAGDAARFMLGAVSAAVQGGGAAMSWFADRWKDLSGVVKGTIGGISDALAAGEWELAAKIAWLGLKLAWATGMGELTKLWIKFKAEIKKKALDAFFAIPKIAIDAIAKIKSTWLNLTTFMSNIWTNIKGDALEGWYAIEKVAKESAARIRAAIDPSFDFEARMKTIRSEFVEKMGDTRTRRRETVETIEENRKTDQKQIDKAKDATQAKVDQVADVVKPALTAAFDKEQATELAKVDKELNEARAEWLKASETANEATQVTTPDGPDAPKSNFQQLLDDLQARIAGAGEAQKQMASRGTFNAAAVQSLNTTRPIEQKMLATQEAMRQHLRRIARASENGGLTFS